MEGPELLRARGLSKGPAAKITNSAFWSLASNVAGEIASGASSVAITVSSNANGCSTGGASLIWSST